MQIEFKTVQSWWKEQHEKDLNRKLNGDASVPFENEEDIITKITVDFDDIKTFEQGVVYHNDVVKDCVYVTYDKKDESTRNLLVHFDDFKFIYEKVTGKKILTAQEILNEQK